MRRAFDRQIQTRPSSLSRAMLTEPAMVTTGVLLSKGGLHSVEAVGQEWSRFVPRLTRLVMPSRYATRVLSGISITLRLITRGSFIPRCTNMRTYSVNYLMRSIQLSLRASACICRYLDTLVLLIMTCLVTRQLSMLDFRTCWMTAMTPTYIHGLPYHEWLRAESKAIMSLTNWHQDPSCI